MMWAAWILYLLGAYMADELLSLSLPISYPASPIVVRLACAFLWPLLVVVGMGIQLRRNRTHFQ